MPEKDDLVPNVGFIWDIDGVIVDSPHEEAWRITATKEPWNAAELSSGFYFTNVASRSRYEGGNNILRLKGVYNRLGAKTRRQKDVMLEKFCTEKNTLIKELIRAGEFKLFPDAVTLLLKARSLGVRQAAASASKNANTMLTRATRARVLKDILGDFGALGRGDTLHSAFDVDACGLDLGGKEGTLKFAAEHLNDLPGGKIEKFVVFEDAPGGVKAAKSLGYYSVGVLRIGSKKALREAGADVVVGDLREVELEDLMRV